MIKQQHMNQEQKQASTPRKPDFTGDGVAVWINKTATGSIYLNIKVVGHEQIYAYLNKGTTIDLHAEG